MSESSKRQYRARPRSYVANGPYIQELREEHGLTLEDMAKEAQMSAGQLSRIETGETPSPRYGTLDRIALVFGLTRQDIILKRRDDVPETPGLTEENVEKLEARKQQLRELDKAKETDSEDEDPL